MADASLDVLCALRIEALAARRGGREVHVHTVGMGPQRARDFGGAIGRRAPGAAPLAVLGVAGGLAAHLRPGDVVVADSVATTDGTIDLELPGADTVAESLEAAGLRAMVGPLVSSPIVVRGDERSRLARSGAFAVDMETAWLADAARRVARPLIAVRVVLDTHDSELLTPRTLRHAPGVLGRFGPIVTALERWATEPSRQRSPSSGPRSR